MRSFALPIRALCPIAVAVWLFAALFSSMAGAQEAAGDGAAAADAERVGQLIETLENDAARERLIEQLRLLMEAEEDQAGVANPEQLVDTVGGGVVGFITREIAQARERLTDVFASLSNVPDFFAWLGEELRKPEVRYAIFTGALGLAFTLGAGALAAFGVMRLTQSIWPDRDGDDERHFANIVLRALGRIVLSLFYLSTFSAVSNAALVVLADGSMVRQIAVSLILTVAVQRVVNFVIGELIRPRYVRVSKEDCKPIVRSCQRIATVAIFGNFLVTSVSRLGLPAELSGVLFNLLGLIVLIMVVRLIFATGGIVTRALAKATGPLAVLARVLGRVWLLMATLYSLFLFLIWSLGVERFNEVAIASLGSLAVIVAALALDGMVIRARAAAAEQAAAASEAAQGAKAASHPASPPTSPPPGPRTPQPHAKEIAHTTWRQVLWPLRLAIAAAALLIVAQFWGLDVIGWVRGENGQAILSTFLNIALLCIVALVIWDLLRRAIESWLSEPDTDGSAARRTQRARTLLPLVRSGLGIVLSAVVLLAVLAELGINIAPLLAGAGVIGLAIGFGSQALVRDVISGAFMLAENTLSVGDVVRLGAHSGVVEALTIRSVRLRDLSGTVHTIPLGEITAVENMTKDFSFYVMDIGVSYGDDVDQVIEVLKELGAELQEDPELGWDMLEPLEVLGVDQFADSAVIIKARIKTVPLRQWAVGREFNRRMKKRFDELGISIPFPQMTVSYLAPEVKDRAPERPLGEPEQAEVPRVDGDAEIGKALAEAEAAARKKDT